MNSGKKSRLASALNGSICLESKVKIHALLRGFSTLSINTACNSAIPIKSQRQLPV